MKIEIAIVPDDALGSFNVRYIEMLANKEPLNVSMLTLSVKETMQLVSDLLMSYVEIKTYGDKEQKQQSMDRG